MKYKTTAKAIRQFSPADYTLSVGYCDLCDLLRFHDANAYTCGVYGWNFDIYELHGFTICTGYRGMVGKRARQVREANKAARLVNSWNNGLTYEEQKTATEKLLFLFLSANCPNSGEATFPATMEEAIAFAKA